MTPTAVTPAGRGTKSKPTARSNGHRGGAREQTAPRRAASTPVAPRRVSGPVGGVTRTKPAPARQRARRAPRPATRAPLYARALASVAALPDHRLLDRIVRGRYWIPILGVLLAGIVAMQVEVLKLSANMGRAIERGTALQSRNEQLRASVTQLSDDQRIERLAAAMGMVMPDPSAVNFLAVHPGADTRLALANIHQPDASAFISSLPAIDTPAGAAAAASTGLAPPAGQATTPSTTGAATASGG
jgi:cell division protein FtsL